MPDIVPNLHPMAVHFPIALLSLSAFFHVAAQLVRRKPAWAAHCAVLAHGTLWLGALAALVAVLFGWQAFNTVQHDDASHVVMLTHRSWALATLSVLVVLAGWDAWRSKVAAIPQWWMTAAVVGAWGLIVVTAWYGGELVYRHGLGVLSLPAAESGRPGHAHGAMRAGEPSHREVMPLAPEVHEQDHAEHEHAHD